jgi:tetratricopeptide (TPR) repeat protein
MNAALLTVLALAIAADPPPEKDPPPDAAALARLHFESAQRHYKVGRFQEAFQDYQRAYELAPFPDLLFNMGQCQRNLKDYDRALFFFRSYLKEKKNATDRVRIEQLIAQLEGERTSVATVPTASVAIAEPEPAPPLTAPPAIEPAADQHDQKSGSIFRTWWFWAIVGAAALGAAGGVYVATQSGGPPVRMGSIGTIDVTGE